MACKAQAAAPQTAGIHSYYEGKIEELESVYRERAQNLRSALAFFSTSPFDRKFHQSPSWQNHIPKEAGRKPMLTAAPPLSFVSCLVQASRGPA